MSTLDLTLSSFPWYLVAFTLGLILLIYWKNLRRDKERQSIPSVSAIPYITVILKRLFQQQTWGDIESYLMNAIFGMSHLYYDVRMIQGVWLGRQYIFCFGLDACEKILRSTSALEKEEFYTYFKPWLGTSLLISGSQIWRKRRKMLTPAFHFQILHDFLLIFNDHSRVLVGKLKRIDGELIHIKNFIQPCVLDIIIESAMGIRVNSQEEECNEYIQALERIMKSLSDRIKKPWYWMKPIYNLSSSAKQFRKSIDVSHNFTRNIIIKRKEKILEEETRDIIEEFLSERDEYGTKKKRILLDLLLYYHLTDNSFTEDDIMDEVNSFIMAGNKTLSSAISWILYLLGWHKGVQEKVYEELKSIFGEEHDRTITMDDLKKMKYLECVIKESQRLYPALPGVARCISDDIEADGYVIPANSSVVIGIFCIHHDPNIYPNPEIFDPDRFLPENCAKRHPFAYIPFSAGPRNCIGQRFAMMEMKTTLSYILRNFTIRSVDRQDKLSFAVDVILSPKTPIRLVLKKR